MVVRFEVGLGLLGGEDVVEYCEVCGGWLGFGDFDDLLVVGD